MTFTVLHSTTETKGLLNVRWEKSYVAEMECKEVPVSSVIKICADGSRPIIDVKSNPYYKITYERILEKISETKRNRKEEFEEWNRKYGNR